jgi:hypothetical protein
MTRMVAGLPYWGGGVGVLTALTAPLSTISGPYLRSLFLSPPYQSHYSQDGCSKCCRGPSRHEIQPKGLLHHLESCEHVTNATKFIFFTDFDGTITQQDSES